MPIGLTVSAQGTVPQPNFSRAITRSHGRVARLGAQAAFVNLLGHYRSGRTIRNFRTRRLNDGIEFSDDAPGGYFLETGTKAHLIRPRNAKMLRWFDESGEKIFRKSVRHPGQQADPWLAPALTDNAERFIRIYGDAAQDEWQRG